MRNSLKIKIIGIVAVFFIAIGGLFAQDVTTVEAMSTDISNNLDLEAVASIFGDSDDLEDFEKRLNNPELQISNLDLNKDGYVDYLRVVEVSEGLTHLIAIQAVLGDDQFQDVATIEIEKDQKTGRTHVQVVGDVYMYGNDYIIEPVYIHRPVFFSYFWEPYYRPYCSTYYWGYYPSHFHYWRPFNTHVYVNHVHTHINIHHTYHHVYHRRSHVAYNLHKSHRRNDFGRRHPNRSFSKRTGHSRRNLATRRSSSRRVNSSIDNERRGVSNRKGVSKRNVRVTDTKRRVATKDRRNITKSAPRYKGRKEISKRGGNNKVVRKTSTPKRRTKATKSIRRTSKPRTDYAKKHRSFNGIRKNSPSKRSITKNSSYKSTRDYSSRNPKKTSYKKASKPKTRTTRKFAQSKSQRSTNRPYKSTRDYTNKNVNTRSYKKASKPRSSSTRISSKSNSGTKYTKKRSRGSSASHSTKRSTNSRSYGNSSRASSGKKYTQNTNRGSRSSASRGSSRSHSSRKSSRSSSIRR